MTTEIEDRNVLLNLNDKLYLTAEEVAKIIGVSIPTLYNWRTHRKNLPFYKKSGRYFYRKSDVLSFNNMQKFELL